MVVVMAMVMTRPGQRALLLQGSNCCGINGAKEKYHQHRQQHIVINISRALAASSPVQHRLMGQNFQLIILAHSLNLFSSGLARVRINSQVLVNLLIRLKIIIIIIMRSISIIGGGRHH